MHYLQQLPRSPT